MREAWELKAPTPAYSDHSNLIQTMIHVKTARSELQIIQDGMMLLILLVKWKTEQCLQSQNDTFKKPRKEPA